MTGKTVIVTGAGSGIALETADELASQGASLVLIDIDPVRGQAAVERIGRHGITPQLILGDLSLNAGCRQLAAEILEKVPRIDVLVNCAGAWFEDRQVTVDGLERTFALNHMGYFLLTNLLLDRIIASAPARIVCVASEGHAEVTLDFDDLQSEKAYPTDGRQAYCRSKLANVLFTRVLARTLEGTGVTVNCCHPGRILTPFYNNLHRLPPGSTEGHRPQTAGSYTVAYLASSPEVEDITGEYFDDRKPVGPAPSGLDDEAAERLWEVSLRIGGLK